jgi:hypothetical protein
MCVWVWVIIWGQMYRSFDVVSFSFVQIALVGGGWEGRRM